jgi:subtilisin family serine protease
MSTQPAARLGVLTVCLLAVCSGHAAGQCTQAALPPDKVPPKLLELMKQVDKGPVGDTICKKWASLVLGVSPSALSKAKGANLIREAPWTIMFTDGVLQCNGSNQCAVVGTRADDKIRVHRAEPRINAANVSLPANVIGPLLEDEHVLYIAPNCTAFPEIDQLASGSPAETPPTELFAAKPEQGCERTDAAQWGLSDACVPAARANATSPKVVAVLDSGIDCRHPAIHQRIAPGENPVEPRRCPASAGRNYVFPGLPPDNCNNDAKLVCNDHGTAVAGVIASNTVELPGVDRAAKLLSMRILQEDADETVVSPWLALATAILDTQEKDTAANILNISANWYENPPEVAAAIDKVTADGNHLVVGAARTNGTFPEYPAAYTTCNEAVIGVSHIYRGHKDEQYYWGPKAGKNAAYMVAPGVRVLTSYSDSNVGAGGIYKIQVGASLATPHVSGAASLVWSTKEFEKCTAVGVRKLLLECSARDTTIEPDEASRKRLHLGCLFGQRDSSICRDARQCIDRVKADFCSR